MKVLVKKSQQTRKGNKYLRSALIESAKSCGKSNTFLGAKYQRLKARRGANKAAVAIAHHMIKIVYHILTKRQPYRDLGADYHLEKKKEYETKRAVSKLQKLGFEVKLVESTA